MTPEDDAAYYIGIIHDLLMTKHYDWCRNTLEGIAENITRRGRITLRQKEAVDHIITGRLKHDVGPV